jgi:1,4-dihydroxy-6-naphthoate synthase
MNSSSEQKDNEHTLSLGFSPCPNDCFIFDALIHNKIDTEGLTFELVMEDVEALNQKAFRGDLDITKLSYHAFAHLTKMYQLLDAGSALGNNCGPLLITNGNPETVLFRLKKKNLQSPILNPNSQIRIAIPGKYTTANFLLSLAFPDAKNKVEMLFSDIEDAVLTGKVDAGLIIHENRFTFEQKGLKKIIDLGEFWETLTQMPIPLGGIVIKRSFSGELKQKVNRVLRKSVEYAFANPKSSSTFVKKHAQEMSEEVIYKHIDLYVNKYSVDLGTDGRKAVQLLFDKAQQLNVITKIEEKIFL